MTALEGPPEWLAVGKLVRLIPATRGPIELRRVVDVKWPWLVHLEGRPGGVHPLRCLPPE